MRSAVFAGTFDPVTNGHLDLVRRALNIVDRLTVAVAARPEKGVLFSQDDRVAMLREALEGESRLTVTPFTGLLVDYARSNGIGIIIRGIRFISDFEYEFQMALMNRKLRHTVETVFMMPHERYTYISSRLIKEVASLGAPVSGLVPPTVEERLTQRFSRG
jgi:pantetheine-phosphate adenylyltransferase